jgi:hypothetical protein
MKEQDRIDFIIARDGLDGAIDFASRTIKSYRTAVLTSRKRGHKKPHHASLEMYRRSFIESYVVLKKFLQETS